MQKTKRPPATLVRIGLHRYALPLILGLLAPASHAADHYTPFGAERAANADGSIPAWSGGFTRTQAPEQGFAENPYAQEKPLITITAENLQRYADQLTPGQLAMFANYPTSYRMQIYPSRRSAAAPDWVYAGTQANLQSAHLVNDGAGIDQQTLHPGIPFARPKTALEIVWNHLLRWRGTYIERVEAEGAVYPNASRRFFRSRQEVAFPTYRRTQAKSDRQDILLYYSSFTLEPASAAGGGFLLVDTLDHFTQPRLSWGYDSGQRRVRRIPFVENDGPAIMGENLRTVDDTDMLNGDPTLYDWTLIGKQERWIAYNNYALPTARPDALLTPFHLNPDWVRWEKHRVWVIQATLKPDRRHIYHKRVFYLDEDTWSIAMVENYDLKDELWRLSVAHLSNFDWLPMVFTVADVFHDFRLRLYNFKGLLNGEKSAGNYNEAPPDDSYFQPARLQQRAMR